MQIIYASLCKSMQQLNISMQVIWSFHFKLTFNLKAKPKAYNLKPLLKGLKARIFTGICE